MDSQDVVVGTTNGTSHNKPKHPTGCKGLKNSGATLDSFTVSRLVHLRSKIPDESQRYSTTEAISPRRSGNSKVLSLSPRDAGLRFASEGYEESDPLEVSQPLQQPDMLHTPFDHKI